jgi:hypothetical protein
MLLAERPDQGLRAPRAGAGHGGEPMVLDLVVQAAKRGRRQMTYILRIPRVLLGAG